MKNTLTLKRIEQIAELNGLRIDRIGNVGIYEILEKRYDGYYTCGGNAMTLTELQTLFSTLEIAHRYCKIVWISERVVKELPPGVSLT